MTVGAAQRVARPAPAQAQLEPGGHTLHQHLTRTGQSQGQAHHDGQRRRWLGPLSVCAVPLCRLSTFRLCVFRLAVFKHGRIDVHRLPVARQAPGAGVQTRPAAAAQLAQELRKLSARRHRQAEFAQPAAQRAGRRGGLLRQRRQGKAGIAGNAASPRQRRHGQQFALLAQQIRGAGQTLGAGRPARRQPRQNLAAQKSAIVADIRIAGIAHQR